MTTDERDMRPRGVPWWAALAGLAALLAAVVPLLVVAVPPLHDYPFHLARVDLLARMLFAHAQSPFYAMGSFLLPDVGADVLLLGLTRLVPVEVAGRLFLAVVLLLTLGGTVVLHRALHRRWSAWPLLAAFFLYNWIVLYGFLSYLLGVALMLWAVAAWVALRRLPAARALAATGAALGLLFCHLEALGLFAVAVGGLSLHEAAGGWRQDRAAALRGLVLGALPFAVSLAVFLAVSPTAGDAGLPMAYFPSRSWKPVVLYRTLLSSLPWLDALTLGPLCAAIALCWRRLRLAAGMGVVVALLLAAFAVLPFALFGSLFGDARLPVGILFLAIAGTDLRLESRAAWRVAGVLAVALLLVRTGGIARAWQEGDAVLAPLAASLATIPDGSVVYVASPAPPPTLLFRHAAEREYWHPPLKHAVSLAALGRTLLVPATWADPAKQPLHLLPAYLAAADYQGHGPLEARDGAALAAIIARIAVLRAGLPVLAGHGGDYLLLLYPELLRGALPPGAAPAGRGPHFLLLRLEPPHAP